jgi:hypothetical protein
MRADDQERGDCPKSLYGIISLARHGVRLPCVEQAANLRALSGPGRSACFSAVSGNALSAERDNCTCAGTR